MDRFSLKFPISNVQGNICYENRTDARQQTDTMKQIGDFFFYYVITRKIRDFYNTLE
jgi:hypothetical protein